MALVTCRYGATDMVPMSRKPFSFPASIPKTRSIRMRILVVMDYLNRIQKK